MATLLGADEIGGSFTHVFQDEEAYERLVANRYFTITQRWQASWWKRPWYWIRRKPTRWERVHKDVQFGEMEIINSGASVEFRSR